MHVRAFVTGIHYGVVAYRRAGTAVHTLLGVSALQATLGVTTLLTFVPTPLAAMHQAGSLTLLSAALWSAHELRKPKKLLPKV